MRKDNALKLRLPVNRRTVEEQRLIRRRKQRKWWLRITAMRQATCIEHENPRSPGEARESVYDVYFISSGLQSLL